MGAKHKFCISMMRNVVRGCVEPSLMLSTVCVPRQATTDHRLAVDEAILLAHDLESLMGEARFRLR
jgi:hypothetical protein